MLTPALDSPTQSYTAIVANSVMRVIVMPIANDSNATVNRERCGGRHGSPTAAIDLKIGENVIAVGGVDERRAGGCVSVPSVPVCHVGRRVHPQGRSAAEEPRKRGLTRRPTWWPCARPAGTLVRCGGYRAGLRRLATRPRCRRRRHPSPPSRRP